MRPRHTAIRGWIGGGLALAIVGVFLSGQTAAPATSDDHLTVLVTMDNLVLSDPANDPIETLPGHTVELFCPPNASEEHARQCDVTNTFLRVTPAGELDLVTFYNETSAASTTDQFWFFDVDLDDTTGGPDCVHPSKPAGGGCENQVIPVIYFAGFETYIHSSGAEHHQLEVFRWDGFEWVEVELPPTTENHQGKLDNPANPYPEVNGYRGVCRMPVELLEFTGPAVRLHVRSWSEMLCCGDDMGGEGRIMFECAAPATLCGDCDLDAQLTILDAFRVARIATGLAPEPDRWEEPGAFSACNPAGRQLPAADAAITVTDALLIARYVVGLDVLTCCP